MRLLHQLYLGFNFPEELPLVVLLELLELGEGREGALLTKVHRNQGVGKCDTLHG